MVWPHPNLLRPDAQVEVEASLKQQVLHIVGVDGEVEVQGVSEQLVGLLIALPDRKHNQPFGALLLLHSGLQGRWSVSRCLQVRPSYNQEPGIQDGCPFVSKRLLTQRIRQ